MRYEYLNDEAVAKLFDVAVSTVKWSRLEGPGGYLLPEFFSGRGEVVADDIGHDLPSGTTQGNPDPAFVGPFQDE